MSESAFKLTDKTIVLAGRFGPLIQNLVAKLTEYGADVAVITDDVKGAQRLCQNISDLRDVSDRFGRAAAIDSTIKTDKDVENLFSRSAELFGTAEIYIDAHLWGLNLPFTEKIPAQAMSEQVKAAISRAEKMTSVANQFLKGRTRGKIVFLFHQLDHNIVTQAGCDSFDRFTATIGTMAKELAPQNIAVNGLAVGANEEYLLTRFPKAPTIQKALLQLQQSIPCARLVDYNEIANMIGFMASPLSQGLSGQTITLNHGA